MSSGTVPPYFSPGMCVGVPVILHLVFIAAGCLEVALATNLPILQGLPSGYKGSLSLREILAPYEHIALSYTPT